MSRQRHLNALFPPIAIWGLFLVQGTLAQPQGRFVNLRPIFGEEDFARHHDPWVSEDELRLYFVSRTTGSQADNDIYMVERNSLDEPFGSPTRLPDNVNAPGMREGGPFLFNDELAMLYDGDRDGFSPLENQWITTRPSLTEPWSDPKPFFVDAVDDLDYVWAVELSADERTVFFTAADNGGTDDLYQARRAGPDLPFGPPEPLASLNTGLTDNQQTVSSDGLTIIYESRHRADFAVELWAASRNSIDEPFANPMRLSHFWPDSEVDRNGWGEFTPYISRDWPANGSKLYFGAGDNFVDWSIYEATWVSESISGDYNFDGVLDANDIHLLSAAIRDSNTDSEFDLNNDSLVDQRDLNVWVTELRQTWFGDSNLDGVFDSADFVAVFTSGQYEDGIPMNSNWATGDWTGDAEFTSADLVVAFQDGGFERGQRAAYVVPEPSDILLLVLSVTVVLQLHSRVDLNSISS